MVSRSGIRRITPHSARHTYATHKLEEECSIQWLSAQLGHSSIQITVDTYGHMAQRKKVTV
jgi:integrase